MSISIPDRIAFLKKTQLVRGLGEARLAEIAGRLVERQVQTGEAAVVQGRVADRIFLIYSGRVRLPVRLSQPQAQPQAEPALVGEGYYLGEEALSPGAFYADTIRAVEQTLLLELTRSDFHLLPSIFIFERVDFLKRIHLFYGLNDEQLSTVAELMEERTFVAGTELVKEGAEGDSLFLIFNGKVRVTRLGDPKPLATFVQGDYIGEESVLSKKHRRSATATAVEDTLTLVLTRSHFEKLLESAPDLRANFIVTANSHRLARRIHFSWLHADEVIYFLARKHPLILVQAEIVPALLLIAGLTGMLLSWWFSVDNPGLAGAWWLSLFGTVAGTLWAGWRLLDWMNDYYIVTDQRVVWLEKVIGIYDSRQEAALSGIQRVNVETRLTGQVLDYGDVVVRTIVGTTLNLKDVDHPYQAAALMEEHWRRSKEGARKMEEAELDALLRDRLLYKKERFEQTKGLKLVQVKKGDQNDLFDGQHTFANLFRLRFEQFSTVIYRKHFFVLFQQTWKAALVWYALLGILMYEILTREFSFAAMLSTSGSILLTIWFMLFLLASGWWVYEYIDWSNDIFKVNPEQIMDIDKTPLGQVTSDIASLDNILSIEYQRKGIWQLLWNYGTVFITVGGGKRMAFENVFNPSAVQDDIERRRLERITNKARAGERAEQERIASWFATYYKHEEGYRGEAQGVAGIWSEEPAFKALPGSSETASGNVRQVRAIVPPAGGRSSPPTSGQSVLPASGRSLPSTSGQSLPSTSGETLPLDGIQNLPPEGEQRMPWELDLPEPGEDGDPGGQEILPDAGEPPADEVK